MNKCNKALIFINKVVYKINIEEYQEYRKHWLFLWKSYISKFFYICYSPIDNNWYFLVVYKLFNLVN